MGSGIRPVSVAERRARLAVRHHLAERARTVTDAVADIIALHGTDPASVYLSAWARTGLGRPGGHRARVVRRVLAGADARHAPDRVRGARRPRPGDPGRLHRPDRGTAAQAAHAGRAGCGHRPGRGDLAQGGGGGHRARAGRARLRDRYRASRIRAAAAHADPGRRGQSLRRRGEPDEQAAHPAVRRGADRSRPPARRLDLHPVRLVRRAGPGGSDRGRRAGRAGPPVAAGVRPGAGLRPAVVDGLDRRAGQAGARPARGHRGGSRRRAGHHAHRRRACPRAGARHGPAGSAAARP